MIEEGRQERESLEAKKDKMEKQVAKLSRDNEQLLTQLEQSRQAAQQSTSEDTMDEVSKHFSLWRRTEDKSKNMFTVQ